MKTNKIKIFFILPSLKAGGAERVISFVSQSIDKKKFEPFLLVAGFEKESVYDVSDIQVFYFNKPRILTAIPHFLKFIGKHKPDIVMSSIAHVNKAMATISPLFAKTKFIGREATVLGQNNNKKVSKTSLVKILPNSFNKLDALICQSQDMAKDMIQNFDVSKEKVFVINNPISNLPKIKEPLKDIGVKRFITVGRLTPIKGHLRILEALSKLKEPFMYTIIGDGELKEEIFSKAETLNIMDKIKHIPYTNKVYEFLSKHDLFIQGSYVEGFPNALLESCVVGTPVVAFNAAGGTKEIIEHGINGYMVDTEDQFLEVLESNLEFNSKDVRESVYKKFNQEIIIKQYEDLFIKINNQ